MNPKKLYHNVGMAIGVACWVFAAYIYGWELAVIMFFYAYAHNLQLHGPNLK